VAAIPLVDNPEWWLVAIGFVGGLAFVSRWVTRNFWKAKQQDHTLNRISDQIFGHPDRNGYGIYEPATPGLEKRVGTLEERLERHERSPHGRPPRG
jgi:hypothetical protein